LSHPLDDPAVIAQLVCFQDAFSEASAALMLAADLFLRGAAAAEIRRNAIGQIVEFAPLDVTTLFMTSDCEGNVAYEQILAGQKTGRRLMARDVLYLTRNRFA
jgi:hypothetical protein